MPFSYGLLLFLFLATFFSLWILPLILKKEETPTEETDDEILNPPKFSNISGFYPENFSLELTSEENAKIYYTLDSSNPKTSNISKEYKDYILIYDRSSEPNIYSALGEDEDSPISISRFQPYYRPPPIPLKRQW